MKKTNLTFWKDVYLACIKLGKPCIDAKDMADQAMCDYQACVEVERVHSALKRPENTPPPTTKRFNYLAFAEAEANGGNKPMATYALQTAYKQSFGSYMRPSEVHASVDYFYEHKVWPTKLLVQLNLLPPPQNP